MSALPASVQKQVDEANRLVEEQKAAREAAAAGTPPAQPQLQAVEGGGPTSTPPAQPAAPANQAAAAPAQPATPAQPTADWEHKYNVLQGKYNAEVPRLTRQLQEQEQLLRDMRQQLTNTQTLLASLNPGQAAAKPGAPASPPQRLVKDEEIREYGDDLYDFMRRVVKQETAVKDAEITELKQRLAKAEESVQGTMRTVATTAEERVIAMLNDQVENWQTQNEDPNFLEWLRETDPYSGMHRGDLLEQAWNAHDGPRVVALFKGFQSENAIVTPPSAATPAQPAQPAQPAAPEQQPLDGLVAPGTPKSGTGAPSEQAGKRVWTRPMVQDLYARINEYTKKGKAAPKELQQLEADLIRAQSEGRIQAP